MLLAWLDCRAQGGRMIFRMEDLDPARSRGEYAQAMAGDLAWLGLDWDEGWPEESFCQSRRTAVYEAAFQTLRRQGLVYPCYCTRAQRLAASAPHPGEDRRDSCACARMTDGQRRALEAAGRRPAWKVRTPDETVTVSDGHLTAISQNLERDVGDFIIRRADGVFAYQLAVSVDDMLMGVTRVVRGRDLLESAPRQAWLIKTLGGEPPVYCHGPLIVSGDQKLSKRLGSLSTQALRRAMGPQALVGLLAFLAGLIPVPEEVSPAELAAGFSWARVTGEDIPLERALPYLDI